MCERQAGAEIEVTPEMVEAGAAILYERSYTDTHPPRCLAIVVYRAMEQARIFSGAQGSS